MKETNNWGLVCGHQECNLFLGMKERNKMNVVEVRTGTVEMRTRTVEVEVEARNVPEQRHGH
jgi:hypothetical protein